MSNEKAIEVIQEIGVLKMRMKMSKSAYEKAADIERSAREASIKAADKYQKELDTLKAAAADLDKRASNFNGCSEMELNILKEFGELQLKASRYKEEYLKVAEHANMAYEQLCITMENYKKEMEEHSKAATALGTQLIQLMKEL